MQDLSSLTDEQLASELEVVINKYGSGSHYAHCIRAEQRRRTSTTPVAVITVRMSPQERRLIGQAARTAAMSVNRWCVGVLLEEAQAEAGEVSDE
jgi:predicted HicB family RNase H-like nuclease